MNIDVTRRWHKYAPFVRLFLRSKRAIAILQQSYASRLLNYRSPTQVFDLEQSTKAQHESRHAADQVLRDRHCDQNEDSEIAIRDFIYRRFSIALSVHELGEVVCPLSIAGLEGKIYLSPYGENVPSFVVLPKKIGIRHGGMVEQFEHVH